VIGDGSFLVEDFINAITAQLDRVQDALRLKAVNRPLTYALKDLSLDLHIFVEVDGQGNVKFRTSGPNEAGASTVHLSFTTITKPMIEENTISLAMTRSPLLQEIGFDEEERKRLEQLGVRNAAQLQRLGSTTGTSTVARLAGIPLERLRQAFQQSRPRVTHVRPEPRPAPKPPTLPRPPAAQPLPVNDTPRPPRLQRSPEIRPTPHRAAKPLDPSVTSAPISPVIHLAPNTRRLQLFGNNLLGEGGTPAVRFNQQALNLADIDEDRLVVDLPEDVTDGALEIDLPDGQQLTYELSVTAEPRALANGQGIDPDGEDPWAPPRGR
jgi:hypothetical protein